MTIEEVAAELGAGGVDWAMDRLRRYAPLVGYREKGYDNSFDWLAFESALNLETWLHIEANAYDVLGEDYPDCIDRVGNALDELLPLIAENLRQPNRRGGPTPDNRRQLCADTCVIIWREFHNSGGPYSERLWGACEAYWQACGQPETSREGNLKQWERYCKTTTTQLARTF